MDPQDLEKSPDILIDDDDYARLVLKAYEKSGFQTPKAQQEQVWGDLEAQLFPRGRQKKRGPKFWMLSASILVAAALAGIVWMPRQFETEQNLLSDNALKNAVPGEILEVQLRWAIDSQEKLNLIIKSSKTAYVALIVREQVGQFQIIEKSIAVVAATESSLPWTAVRPQKGWICPLFAESAEGLQLMLSQFEALVDLIPESSCLVINKLPN